MLNDYIEINVVLSEDKSKNEYSFLDLIHQKKNVSNTNLPGDESQSDVMNIAKMLEKKYGKQVTIDKSGCKKRVRVDDYAEFGCGYDSEDSFIDDSEARDIILAPNITNKFGGFFVQDGFLESIEETLDHIEDSNSSRPKSIPEEFPLNKENTIIAVEKNVLCSVNQKPVIEIKKETPFKFDQNQAKQSHEKLPEGVKTALKVKSEPDPPKSQPQQNQPQLADDKKSEMAEKFFKIEPVDLPGDFVQLVDKLRDLPKNYSNKDFTETAESIINYLQGNAMTRNQKKYGVSLLKEKTSINKDNLARRLRNLKKRSETSKMDELLDKLKQLIAMEMPKLIENFNNDMNLYQARLDQWKENVVKVEKENAIASTCGQDMIKKPPRPQAPRKCFRQSTQIKSLVENIVFYHLSRTETNFKKTSAEFNQKVAEEEMKKFITDRLTVLWPEGWVTDSYLWRCCQTPFHKFCVSHSIHFPNSESPQTDSSAKTGTPQPNSSNGSINQSLKDTTNNVNLTKPLNQQPTMNNNNRTSQDFINKNNEKTNTPTFKEPYCQKPAVQNTTPIQHTQSSNNRPVENTSQNIPPQHQPRVSEKKEARPQVTPQPKFPSAFTVSSLKRETEDDVEIMSVIPPKKISLSNKPSSQNYAPFNSHNGVKETMQSFGLTPNVQQHPGLTSRPENQTIFESQTNSQSVYLTPFSMANNIRSNNNGYSTLTKNNEMQRKSQPTYDHSSSLQEKLNHSGSLVRKSEQLTQSIVNGDSNLLKNIQQIQNNYVNYMNHNQEGS